VAFRDADQRSAHVRDRRGSHRPHAQPV